MRKRFSPSLIIALVALFFSLTGAGMAATGYRITSIWQIKPSVRAALRGERGPAGPQGPAGASATNDTADITFTTDGRLVTVPAYPSAGEGYSVAQCPPGSSLLSGGFEIAGGDNLTASQGLVVLFNRPLSSTEWGVAVAETGAWPTQAAIMTTALCRES